MPRWKPLSDELDPQIREFAGRLRTLVDGGGMSVAAVADRTGYSRTSWERYLSGRLLAPRGAIIALAEATGTDQTHLTTLWEVAERAWSRSEMRPETELEPARISRARAALPPVPQPSPRAGRPAGGRTRPAVFLAGTAGALLVLAAVVLLTAGVR
ncbi:helix-turn-helix transcriptional regulator [Streptomyces sp. NPDC052052]|uniref:helix-turn-helix domain-containing protein n=1 Tax=Streptomyces sp. NPDC052052 TaxID=3154756 RepID=UPI00344541E9